SHTPIEGDPLAEYISGNRVTVISSLVDPPAAPQAEPIGAVMPVRRPTRLKVSVFDVSNAANPQIARSTYLDGGYLDSRAVGNQVFLVVQNTLGDALVPQVLETDDASRYETEAEFRARLSGTDFEAALPHLYTRPGGPDSPLVQGPLLSAA